MTQRALRQRETEILRLLGDAERGLARDAIAAALGIGRDICGEWLRRMRKADLIQPTSEGRGSVWVLKSKLETARALIAAEAESKRRETERLRSTDRRDQDEAAAVEAFARPSIQIHKPVGTYSPLQVLGPISVFILA
jgi:hypothetical protein